MNWRIPLALALASVLFEILWFLITGDFRTEEMFHRTWYVTCGAVIYGWVDEEKPN